MSNIEERLWEEKARLSELSAPDDLEERLRKALNGSTPRRKTRNMKSRWRIAVAVLALMLFVVGNQYHALAYYGKTLLGFDGVVNGTLSELNSQGKGQPLNKQVQLANGTLLTINGLMSDENQIIIFYTLSNPNGIQNYDYDFNPSRIEGFRTDSRFISGGSNQNEGHTMTKGFFTFEPVSPLAKKLTISYYDEPAGGQRREKQVTFPYHPDKAMTSKIKQDVIVTVHGQAITIGTITATPTMTLIEGTPQAELGVGLSGIDLIANGVKIPQISGVESQLTHTFKMKYDALPENLQSVQLVFTKTGETVQIPIK